MAEVLTIKFNGEMSELMAALDSVGAKVESAGKESGKKFGSGFSDSFKEAFAGLTLANLTSRAIETAMEGVKDAFKGVFEKESSLADFSALTGVAGESLVMFGEKADELAKKFGGSSLDQITAFKGILSRFGPDLAKSPEALASMTESINTLGKAGGLNAAQSMDALTTAMLQFNVDLKEPGAAAETMAKMMNTMAAGAKEGAAEIPDVAEAIKVAGVAAYGAKMSFEETNSALQVLAAGGKKGSEAGTALRNVLGLLQSASGPAEAQMKKMGVSSAELGEILTTKGLGAALGRLQQGFDTIGTAAGKNKALMEIFGTENAAAAGIMLRSADAMGELTGKITGTDTATQQAAINMNTMAEKWARFKAAISIGIEDKLKSIVQFISENSAAIGGAVVALAAIAVGYGLYTAALGPAIASTIAWTAALLANPITWIVLGIVAAGAAIGAYASHVSNAAANEWESAKAKAANTKEDMNRNREMVKEIEHTQTLFDKYEQLGAKTNKTKAEQIEYRKALEEIKLQYPGLINDGDSFAANMERIKNKSKELHGEIGKLNSEYATLAKLEQDQLRDAKYKERNVAADEYYKTLYGGMWGRGDRKETSQYTKDQGDQAAAWLNATKQELFGAKTLDDFIRIETKFQKQIQDNRDKLGTEAVEKLRASFIKMAKVQRELTLSRDDQSALDGNKPNAETGTAVNTETAGGGAVNDKTAKAAYQLGLDKLKKEEELAKKSVENDEAAAVKRADIAREYAIKIRDYITASKVAEAKDRQDANYGVQIAEEEHWNAMIEYGKRGVENYNKEVEKGEKEKQRIRDYWDKFEIAVTNKNDKAAQDELKAKQDRMKKYADLYQSIAGTIGSMFGEQIFAKTEGALKAGLKSILTTTLDFLEKYIVLAKLETAIEGIVNPFSLLVKAAPYLAALAGLSVAKAAVNSFAVGTDFVPYDQLAYIHKGERIIPAPENRAISEGRAVLGESRAPYRPPQPTKTVRRKIEIGFGSVRDMEREMQVRNSFMAA